MWRSIFNIFRYTIKANDHEHNQFLKGEANVHIVTDFWNLKLAVDWRGITGRRR
jgi:hypothetical protein